MKKSIKVFARSFYISSVIIFCVVAGAAGIAKAYQNTVATRYGQYKKAFEIKDGHIRILDYEIDIPIQIKNY